MKGVDWKISSGLNLFGEHCRASAFPKNMTCPAEKKAIIPILMKETHLATRIVAMATQAKEKKRRLCKHHQHGL